MLYTEDEAKSKGCPILMAINDENVCAGSYCMMWRWFDAECENPELIEIAPKCWYVGAERRGYCGAGGKVRHDK